MASQLSEQLDPPRRRRATGLGASGAPGTLTPAVQTQINTTAASLGINPATTAAALAQISSDGPLVSNAIDAIQKGNAGAAFKDAIPIISGAVALVNPVAGAIVAGALTVGDAVLSALGLLNNAPAQTCSWRLPPIPTGMCFNLTSRPYGPSDPAWVTLEAFSASSTAANAGNSSNPFSQTVNIAVNGGVSLELALLPHDLFALGDQGSLATWYLGFAAQPGSANYNNPSQYAQTLRTDPTWRFSSLPGLQPFELVFCRCYERSLEYPINGYTPVSAISMLTFLAAAWNSKYPNCQQVSIDGTGSSFADSAVLGWPDQWANGSNVAQRNPPVLVNDPTRPLSPILSGLVAAAPAVAGTVGAAALGAVAWSLITKRSVLSLIGM